MGWVNDQWVNDGTTSSLGIGLNQPIKVNTGYGANTQFQTGVNTDANAAQVAGTVNDMNLPVNSLAFNNGTSGLAEQGWTDKVANWFTPQGDRGTSVGGNIMGAVGTGVGAASGLAGMYYAKKNFDLQKDQQDYLKGREAQSDARKSAFAANAGNGAQY